MYISIATIKRVITSTAIILFAHSAAAEPIHYWRFGNGDFLIDSVGTATLTNTTSTQSIHPIAGPGAAFPDFAGPTGASYPGGNPLNATLADAPNGNFTIELLGNFTNLTSSFGTVLAGTGLTALNNTIGWVVQARTFSGITNQLVLLTIDGSTATFIESGIGLATGTDYYFAVSFDVAGTANFYVQDLTAGTALQHATVNHSASAYNNIPNFSIGSLLDGSLSATGLYDEVRLSNTALGANELLISAVPIPPAIIYLGSGLVALAAKRRKG